MADQLKIVMSAGELSGDEHAARLARAISRASGGSASFRGMGGRNLRAAGMDTTVDSEKSASVMGFQEVLGSLSKVWKAYSTMKKLLSEWRPDIFIPVDYAEFNMRLARYASSIGIPVLYYITPQVWAWRSGRVERIKRDITAAAVLFPFEKDFFESRGYERSHFFGHPFAEDLAGASEPHPERDRLLRESGFDPAKPVLAIFPGSRKSEIKRHLELMAEGLKILHRSRPEAQLALAIAPTLSRSDLEKLLEICPEVRIFSGTSIELLRCADAGLLKSGTSNLQALFCALPFVMLYKASELSAFIVRRAVKLREYSIVNVLRPGTVRELIQEKITPELIAAECERLLYDEEAAGAMKRAFAEIAQSLKGTNEDGTTGGGYADRIADLALEIASNRRALGT